MKRINERTIHLVAISLSTLLLAGCTTTPKRTAVPEQLIHSAAIKGLPDVRQLGDVPSSVMTDFLEMSPEEIQKHFSGLLGRKHAYLVLSGGGSNGAFGAGLLNGWTAKGTRPEFTVVTGISAGAILAPWAFLGSDYDHVARELFTKYDTKATIKTHLVTGLWREAFTESTPLRNLIYGYLGPVEIEKIAAEHRKGRRLIIGTTNMDMLRPISWNMGAIANSDYPEKRDLMVNVILASASIPVAFPPVLIDVEADGKTYQEMHVDGGLGRQLFFYPQQVHWDQVEEKLQVKGTPELYIIRNAKLYPSWRIIKPTIVDLGSRSLSSLIRTQGIGDILKIYLKAKRDGIDFHLAYIPKEFSNQSKEAFDLEYMNALYNLAYESITEKDPWTRELN